MKYFGINRIYVKPRYKYNVLILALKKQKLKKLDALEYFLPNALLEFFSLYIFPLPNLYFRHEVMF